MRFPAASGAGWRLRGALCIEPAFILLDEPFSGIDPIAVLDLQEIIFDLKASGIGVLITDHNVRETLSVTDRAYIINDGRIFRARNAGAAGERSGGTARLSGREFFAGVEAVMHCRPEGYFCVAGMGTQGQLCGCKL